MCTKVMITYTLTVNNLHDSAIFIYVCIFALSNSIFLFKKTFIIVTIYDRIFMIALKFYYTFHRYVTVINAFSNQNGKM